MESYKQLKNILCTEIDDTVEDIMRNDKMSVNDLEVIDKLTHSLKSITTIMAMEDSGYSYNDGYSGMRRRDGMGRYADSGYSNRRYYDGEYSGRRYSRDEGKSHMIHQFENLMNDASSQEERDVLQSAINKLKNM